MNWYIVYNYGVGIQFHIIQATERQYENFIKMYNSMEEVCGDFGGLLEFNRTKFNSKEEAEKACYRELCE